MSPRSIAIVFGLLSAASVFLAISMYLSYLQRVLVIGRNECQRFY